MSWLAHPAAATATLSPRARRFDMPPPFLRLPGCPAASAAPSPRPLAHPARPPPLPPPPPPSPPSPPRPADLPPFTAAYSRYAADHLRAWTTQADPALSPALWPQYRAAISMLRPAQLNQDARTRLIAADAALAVIPPALLLDDQTLAARA